MKSNESTPAHARKNLTFPPGVIDLAQEIMELRSFTDLSGFLSQLVREEWERRRGPAILPTEPARTVIVHKARASDKPSKSKPHDPSN